MKFFSRLFGKKSKPPRQRRWSMNPLQAKYRAKLMVKSAARLGVVLDYSVESLANVDMLIDKERETGIGLTKEMAEVLLSIGSYVGEVMVRNMEAVWAYGAEIETQDPLLIIVDGKYALNVVSMVFHRFMHGEPHGIVRMYQEAQSMPATDATL